MTSKKASWIGAMRLRTLPLAASCVLVGSALGWHHSTDPWLIFSLTLLTTLLLQILSNLANDYGDYAHGVDNADRVGPQRAMQSGAITKREMKRALLITTVLTFISGVLLLWISFAAAGLFTTALLFLLVGIGAIIAAFKYTVGKNPYGYRGLGDLFVFVFFGIVGVCGTAFLHTKLWDTTTLFPAITIGALSCAVLNLNNLRDHVNDAASGKITIVVRMGFERAKGYHLLLLTVAFVALGIWFYISNFEVWQMLCALPTFILIVIHGRKVIRTTDAASLDPELKKVALGTFLLSLLFFVVTLAGN